MFNIGGGELLIIILVIIIFIGPSKLPEVANTLGKLSATIRRFNQSFQDEIRDSFEDPIEEAARERGKQILGKESKDLENIEVDDTDSKPIDGESDVDKER